MVSRKNTAQIAVGRGSHIELDWNSKDRVFDVKVDGAKQATLDRDTPLLIEGQAPSAPVKVKSGMFAPKIINTMAQPLPVDGDFVAAGGNFSIVTTPAEFFDFAVYSENIGNARYIDIAITTPPPYRNPAKGQKGNDPKMPDNAWIIKPREHTYAADPVSGSHIVFVNKTTSEPIFNFSASQTIENTQSAFISKAIDARKAANDLLDITKVPKFTGAPAQQKEARRGFNQRFINEREKLGLSSREQLGHIASGTEGLGFLVANKIAIIRNRAENPGFITFRKGLPVPGKPGYLNGHLGLKNPLIEIERVVSRGLVIDGRVNTDQLRDFDSSIREAVGSLRGHADHMKDGDTDLSRELADMCEKMQRDVHQVISAMQKRQQTEAQLRVAGNYIPDLEERTARITVQKLNEFNSNYKLVAKIAPVTVALQTATDAAGKMVENDLPNPQRVQSFHTSMRKAIRALEGYLNEKGPYDEMKIKVRGGLQKLRSILDDVNSQPALRDPLSANEPQRPMDKALAAAGDLKLPSLKLVDQDMASGPIAPGLKGLRQVS